MVSRRDFMALTAVAGVAGFLNGAVDGSHAKLVHGGTSDWRIVLRSGASAPEALAARELAICHFEGQAPIVRLARLSSVVARESVAIHRALRVPRTRGDSPCP